MKSFITPVFVGRSKEVSQLDDALAAIQAGAGRCVLVSGDAGIGKSRLIVETEVRTKTRGFTTLVGRCFEQDRSFFYAPLIDMLRPFFARARELTCSTPWDRSPRKCQNCCQNWHPGFPRHGRTLLWIRPSISSRFK
jgi:hypothetical protein